MHCVPTSNIHYWLKEHMPAELSVSSVPDVRKTELSGDALMQDLVSQTAQEIADGSSDGFEVEHRFSQLLHNNPCCLRFIC